MRKKVFGLTMAALMSVSVFASCGRGGNAGGSDDPVDPDKTQLNVAVWDGGFRYNWLENWGDEFEKMYANHSFEEGKVGVQVRVAPSKNLALDPVATNIKEMTEEVIICEQVNTTGFVREKSALDISDIVKETLSDYGETRSIEDKLSESDKAFYGNGTGTYYALPWYESLFGVQYDVDLFEENNYYFAAEGQGDSNGFVRSPSTPRGAGPDGDITTTYDNGLPATYDDFFKLCDKMVADGVVPIIWTGMHKSYMNYFMQSLVADYEGFEQMSLNYTMDGTKATSLIKSINGSTITYEEPTEIYSKDGYLLQKQAGRYYALKFLERLINTKGDDGQAKYIKMTDCYNSSLAHTETQGKFLRSKYTDSYETIAMIAEGSWWYNEATPYFNAMSSIEGAGMKERRIGFMPFPKADSTRLGEATYMNTWITNIVINANTAASKLDCAKEFVKFIHTDKSLSAFTRDSNGVRPFNYELTEEDKVNTSYYAQQMMYIHNTAKVVNPWSTNTLMINNLSSFTGAFISKGYTNVVEGLRNISAEEYFQGLQDNWTKANWDNAYSRFFD